ncbi:hypothetical protein IAT38_004126 [Cryptococcus sp. DSM 104549]
MAFSALVATTGLLFMIWHTWHYDRWRCMLYSKNDWFRAMMCHILMGSIGCLLVYTWIDVHVLYAEYWIYLPELDRTMVTPFQLWTKKHYDLWKVSLWFITAGWGFLQGVHLEEFLYWGYLIKSINTPGGPQSSWLRSGFFKVWIGLFVACFALLVGSLNIERENLDMMRAYLFCVGSTLSIALASASIGLCIIFPKFLKNVRRQGASFEVLERLHFFAEMNELRTVCRVLYSIAFLILAADGLSKEQKINKNQFWEDTLYLIGQLGLFASTCLSVVILLPRNMSSESLPPSNVETFHPMVPYARPTPDGYSAKHFFELGERLNVGAEAMASGLGLQHAAGPQAGFEMAVTPPSHEGAYPASSSGSDKGSDNSSKTHVEAPFAEAADKSKKARLSEFPSLPSVVQRFKSPFETAEERPKGPTQIFVTTHQEIREE